MNVLHTAAVRELRSHLSRADEEAPIVVLTGREDALSAGLDLATLADGGEAAQELLVEMGELLVAAYGGSAPLVVACRGHAVAAGAMLLLVADVRVGAVGGYRVGFTEPSRGMPLPELPVVLARERLGRRHLQAATLLGRVADPAEAVEMGFLDELVPPERLDAVACERAQALAALGAAYAGTIRSVRAAALARMEALLGQAKQRLAELRAGSTAR